jgi:hypothetical protein
MRHKLLTGISVAVLMIALLTAYGFSGSDGQVAYAEDSIETRLVNVYGEGEISVAPDHASINMGVETKDADAAVAQQENAKVMAEVIAAIKAAGIAESNIQTTGYNLYQTRDYYSNETSDPYYVASNTVTVEIDNINLVGMIIDAGSKAGANTINSVAFSVKDDSAYYQQALALAMADAKGKATAIMKTFGATPSVPYSVSETSTGGGIYYDYAMTRAAGEMSADYSTPVQAGEITISAQVSVSYDY